MSDASEDDLDPLSDRFPIRFFFLEGEFLRLLFDELEDRLPLR